MAQLFFPPRSRTIDANLQLVSGARAYFYQTETTTPQIVYQDADLTIPHPQPVEADSAGLLPAIYLDDRIGLQQYRLELKTATEELIYALDAINPFIFDAAQLYPYLQPRTEAERLAGVIPSNYAYPESDVRRYGAIADRTTDCLPAFNQAAAVAVYTRVIFIPSARNSGYYYKLSSTWTLLNLDSVTIYGEGDTSLLVIANIAGFNAITVDSSIHLTIRNIGISGVDGSGNGIEFINDSFHCHVFNVWVGWVSGACFKVTLGISIEFVLCRADRNNGYRPASLTGGFAEGAPTHGIYVPSTATGRNNNCGFHGCQVNACGSVYGVQIGDPGGLPVQSFNWHGGLIQGASSGKQLYMSTQDSIVVGTHIEPSPGNTQYVVIMDGCVNSTIVGGVITGDVQLMSACTLSGVEKATGAGIDFGSNCDRCFVRDFTQASIVIGPTGGKIKDRGTATDIRNVRNASNDRYAAGHNIRSPARYFSTDMETWVGGASPTVPCGFTLLGAPTLTRDTSVVRKGTYSAKVVMSADLTQGFQISPGPENAFIGKVVTVEAWVRNLTTAGLARLGMLEGGTGAVVYELSYYADVWERILVSFYPSASATSITLKFTGQVGTVYWDAIRILLSDDTPKYEVAIDTNATPNISYGGRPVNRLLVGASGTDITSFAEPHVGMPFDLIWTGNRTLKNNANIVLKAGADTVGVAGTTRRLSYGSDGVFREV